MNRITTILVLLIVVTLVAGPGTVYATLDGSPTALPGSNNGPVVTGEDPDGDDGMETGDQAGDPNGMGDGLEFDPPVDPVNDVEGYGGFQGSLEAYILYLLSLMNIG